MPEDKIRKIIHVDMDAFFASIEQRDNPAFRGRPLAVGYAGERGVVAAASYEARKYGIRSAMPSVTALKRCPHLIFVSARFNVYRSVSQEIMEIFKEYTDLVEPLSLDEAFLDVTENHKDNPSATLIAREIKNKIFQKTHLTASAGVSVNKFLAKIASDQNKPDGLFVITDKDARSFVKTLPVEKFFGIGRITAGKMHSLGINTGADLEKLQEAEMVKLFGKNGLTYYDNARAIDNREVCPYHLRKSIGSEVTFLKDLYSKHEVEQEIEEIIETTWKRVTEKNFLGRTVTLKIKNADFEQNTRSRTLSRFIDDYSILYQITYELLSLYNDYYKGIRLIGVTISNPKEAQESKFIQLEFEW